MRVEGDRSPPSYTKEDYAMAEIRVEKKKTNIWPWIIGLILLALIIWGLSEGFNDGNDTRNEAPEVTRLEVPMTQPAPPASLAA